MSNQGEQVTIEILDKQYTISCPPGEKQDLLESARILNERLREVRGGGKVLGTERMAVITALNIVHEMEQQKRHQASLTAEFGDDLKRLEDRVRQAVGRRTAEESVD